MDVVNFLLLLTYYDESFKSWHRLILQLPYMEVYCHGSLEAGVQTISNLTEALACSKLQLGMPRRMPRQDGAAMHESHSSLKFAEKTSRLMSPFSKDGTGRES